MGRKIRAKFALCVCAGIIMILSLVASSGKTIAGNQVPDYWTITVVKAEGLKNKDWGVNRVSDPYVEVRGIITKGGSIRDCVKDLKKGTRLWDTSVKKDNTSPVWNETFRWIPPTENFGGLYLQFWVWDQDPAGRAFLGKAVLGYAKEGVYRLRLRKRLVDQPMPGVLTVSIKHVIAEQVIVPRFIGMDKARVVNTLRSKGLKMKLTVSYTKTTTADHAKIYDQYPKPGERVLKGSTIHLFQHLPQMKIMPSLRGLPYYQAQSRVSFLLKPLRQSTVIVRSKHPERWFRATGQSVRPGTRIPLDTVVTVKVAKPLPGTKVKMPDLVGLKAYEAAKEMSRRHIRYTWAREESSLEENGKIIKQVPQPNIKIPFDDPKSVVLYVGHYSDGLSYFSAKPVTPGVVALSFNKSGMTQFRRVKVKKSGYLVLRKISSPFSVKCSFFSSGSPVALGREGRYFDQAIRVTPGEWIFSVYPEFRSDTSKEPVRVRVELLDEIDSAEPNDIPEAATIINPDTRIELGYIGTYDKDFYTFQIKKPGYITITDLGPMKKTSTKVVPRMKFYDASHHTLYSGPTSIAKWLSSGIYYVAFYCEGSDEQFDTVPYGIDISFVEDTEGIEPNNTLAQATPVKVPARVGVRFETRGSDYFLLKSTQPGYVVITCSNKLPFPIKLWSINSDGSEQRAKFLPCAVRITKETSVRISQEMAEDFKVDSPTNIDFMFIPGKQDIFEPNDSIQQAKPVMVGQDIQALSMPSSDRDYYRFKLDKPDIVTFMILRKGPKCPLIGQLFDRDGNKLNKELISFPFRAKLPSGEYLVEIFQENGLEGLHISPYTFKISAESIAPAQENLSQRYQVDKRPDKRTVRGISLAQEAYILYLKGKYQDAARLYIEASRLIPTCAAIWNDLGACYFHLNNIDRAETNFKKATLINSGYALAWRNLSVVARKAGDHSKSIQYVKKAASLEPTAENLRYAGYALLVAGVDAQDKAKQSQFFKDSLVYFEQSLEKKNNEEVERRVKLLKKYLSQ